MYPKKKRKKKENEKTSHRLRENIFIAYLVKDW